MKKFTLSGMLTLALLLTMGLKVSAQSNVLKINPLSLFVLTGNVKYERTFADKMSAQLGVYYGGIGLSFGADVDSAGVREKIKYSWLGVTPEFRYYVTNGSKDAPEGFYVGPYLVFQNAGVKFTATVFDQTTGQAESVEAKASVITYGGGAMFGYQFLLGDVVTLDMWLGGAYRASSASVKATANGEELDDSVYTGLGFSGFGIRSGIALGFVF